MSGNATSGHLARLVMGLAVLAAPLFAAGEPPAPPFCREAQQVLAGTAMEARVEQHDDYQGFVESKAGVSPLTVQQYFSNPPTGEGGMPRTLSCKMKTAERINAAGGGSATAAAARGDSSCQAIHRYWLDRLLTDIPAQQRAVSDVVVDEEELTFMGPMWLDPWPFTPAYRDEAGRLHLRTRALYVPHAWWIPMPDRFKGTYYCHLVSPPYLEALLRGTVSIAE